MKQNGRPRMFSDPETLQKKVDEYFEQLGDTPATITGLSLFLGFCSRQSFADYKKNKGFSYTIKKAHARIEQCYEQKLHKAANVTGAIFALKNLGWTDMVTQETIVRRPQKLFTKKNPEGIEININEN